MLLDKIPGLFQDLQLLSRIFLLADCEILMKTRWRFLATFLRPVFSASRVQHISDLHSKFALRPHHVWKYGRHPISDCWD